MVDTPNQRVQQEQNGSRISRNEILGKWYQNYGPYLRARCTKMLHSSTDAEDAVQEVFEKAIDLWSRFELPDNDRVSYYWLSRLATHNCLHRMRSKRNRPWLSISDQCREMDATDANQEVAYQLKEVMRLLGRQLDEKGWTIVDEHFVRQRTLDEVSCSTGISKRAILKRLSKYRKQLKVAFQERHEARGTEPTPRFARDRGSHCAGLAWTTA